MGFPYEGPAPLEAIAQGCVFINPQFNPAHNSENTNFFKGKPTARQVGYCINDVNLFLIRKLFIGVDVNSFLPTM